MIPGGPPESGVGPRNGLRPSNSFEWLGLFTLRNAGPLQLPERFAAVFSNATRAAISRGIALREDLLRNRLQACISPLNILCPCSAATYGQPCQLLLTLAASSCSHTNSPEPANLVAQRLVSVGCVKNSAAALA
jgi:hypothetical protein